MASSEGYPFVYYFSSWLPSAAITKLTSFEWRNYNQLFFNFTLIMAAYVILCVKIKRVSLLILLGLICLADLPTTLDALLNSFFREGYSWSFATMFNLRGAAPNLISQWSHTANHGPIITLATALMLLNYKQVSAYLLIGACGLLYSPLGALALFPLMLVQCGRRGVLSTVKQLMRQPLSYAALGIVIVAIVFYTQNRGTSTELELGLRNVNPIVINKFYAFWVIQSIFLLVFFFAQNKKDPIFWIAYLTFVSLPFISYGGNYNEIIFKASLPFWLCASVFFARIFQYSKKRDASSSLCKISSQLSLVIAYCVIGCFAINTISTLRTKFSRFNHPNNIIDPYESDYYSPKARAARESTNRYRDFGGMRDLPAQPILPYILKGVK